MLFSYSYLFIVGVILQYGTEVVLCNISSSWKSLIWSDVVSKVKKQVVFPMPSPSSPGAGRDVLGEFVVQTRRSILGVVLDATGL